MRWRGVGCALLVALGLGLLGAFAWATRNPRHPALAELAGVRGIGVLAQWVTKRWAPDGLVPSPPAPEAVAGDARPEIEPPPTLPDGPWVWAHGGQRLHEEPDHETRALLTFGLPTEVVWLGEEHQGWRRVVTEDGIEGWLPARPGSAEPPLGRATAPVVPVAGQSPDPELLALAIQQLQAPVVRDDLGGWELVTDLDDPGLLASLDRLASSVEPAFVRRVGYTPIDRPREVVVLFARQAAYEALAARDPQLARAIPTGHFGHGIVALSVEQRSRASIESALIHELAHTLARRAIGPALPPWLSEGLADDLATLAIDDEGRLDPTAKREVREGPAGWTVERGWLAARPIASAALTRGSGVLRHLLGLDTAAFVAPPAGERYAVASTLVAMLLDSPTHGAAFRRFLGAVAAGGSAEAAALEQTLGLGLDELETELEEFLG